MTNEERKSTVLKDNNQAIFLILNQHFQNFLIKWPLFTSRVKIDIENKRESCNENTVVLEFSAVDLVKETTVEIELKAHKRNHETNEIDVFFSIYIAPLSLEIFNKDNFFPADMYQNFQFIVSRVLCLNYIEPSHIMFAFSEDYEPIEVIARIYKSNGLSHEVTHRIYEWGDETFLKSRNIDVSNVKHLRNLYLLTKYTNINNLIIADDFKDLLLKYSDNFEMYNNLIAMEKI